MENAKSKSSSIATYIGVVFALLIAIGAYIVSPNVMVAITQRIGNATTLSPMVMRLIFTVICFFIGLTITMLVVSLVKPKDARTANENKLEEERNKMREAQRIERMKNRR
ncbi:MAG: hypothetical protein GC179_23215 [Anaerolineaceae bacterium]|nr:hypothetical protein [Anaerolineaceae bacterium]